MTNNPLPAALASIKRYAIVAYDGENGPHWEYREHPAGEFCFFDKVEKLFATLPPPADGAVGYVDKSGLEMFRAGTLGTLLMHGQKERLDSVALYAAPPADSAMELLSEFVYRTTCLSPMEDDGSHKCTIPKELLERARTLLAGRK